MALIGELALSACDDIRLGLDDRDDDRDDDLANDPRMTLAMALGVLVLEVLRLGGTSSIGDFELGDLEPVSCALSSKAFVAFSAVSVDSREVFEELTDFDFSIALAT